MEQNYAPAQATLGCYLEGKVFPRMSEAIRLVRLSAAQDHSVDINNLAAMAEE